MRRALAAVAAALALAGCHTAPLKPALAPDPGQREALAALSDWRASGRVAVRVAAAGWSASFEWREHLEQGELAIRGPFGGGAARVSVSAERIRIDSGGPPLELAAPFVELEPELTARLGFPLPLAVLRYWLLGIPSPMLPRAEHAAGFEQADWEVAYSDYAQVAGSAPALPTRLELSRGSTRIRVIVDRWQVGGG